MHGSVIDVTLVNPYKGIDFGTYPNELHYIRNVFGCPLKLGIYVNRTTDIGRIENVHFNPHSWGRCTFQHQGPRRGLDEAVCLSGTESWIQDRPDGLGIHVGQLCDLCEDRPALRSYRNGEPNVVLTQCGSDISPLGVQIDASQGHAGWPSRTASSCQRSRSGLRTKGQ